jgi:opacity protein-like surface antigen
MKVALTLAVLFASTAALGAPGFVRGGIVTEQSRDTTVRDRDCESAAPPALFGCGFGASGGFGHPLAWEAAAGIALRPHIRLELAFEERPSIDLEANANFTNAGDDQPVRANGRSHALFARVWQEIGNGRVRPFLTASAGVARNELGAVTYSFPAIAPNAVTLTPGGTQTSFAWSAGTGVSFSLSEQLALDVALRYTDLGSVQSDDGTATIVRPARTFMLDIAGTRAALRTFGVSVGVRLGMRRP